MIQVHVPRDGRELQRSFGHARALGLMVVVCLYFKREGWL
jgi:hypothetical protein